MTNTIYIFLFLCFGLPFVWFLFLYLRDLLIKPKSIPVPPVPPVPPVLNQVGNKYYLGIALSKVDPKAYSGWEGKLYGTIPDVRLFENRLSLRGFQSRLILDQEATRLNVLKVLNDYALLCKDGDTLCVVYSGHGGSVKDDNGDELDGLDETWVLWDGELRDDAIWLALKQFRPGVRVIMFSDSCHSGTAYRSSRRDTSLKMLEAIDVDTLGCHLKFFGGCGDPQISMDMGTNGLFTRTIWNSVYKINRLMTYDRLYERVLARMPRDQKPTYHNIGTQIDSFNKDNIF